MVVKGGISGVDICRQLHRCKLILTEGSSIDLCFHIHIRRVCALREIYLRGFEICVREANPKTVMTSYNCLNGSHTSSSYGLITNVLRGEWGFKGLVMTDWGSLSEKHLDLVAGNDLIMGGYRSEFLKAAVHGTPAEFASDGYVREDSLRIRWNSGTLSSRMQADRIWLRQL